MIKDLLCLNTDAGCGAIFAPPPGFTGDVYTWLVLKYRTDLGFKQEMIVSLRIDPSAKATGVAAGALDKARSELAIALTENLNTTTGSGGRFSAPRGTVSYLDWLSQAYRERQDIKRALFLVARWAPFARASGDYASDLNHAIAQLAERERQRHD